MAENNTFNFDLDAPATPTLTLDPVEEAAPAEEKKPEPAPAPEEVKLTAEEKAMVDAFAQKIDITNSQQVLQYGSACQKKIGDFSEAALAKVSTKDLGEVGNMITDLIGELKSFDANEEQQKGILGFFKKKGDQIDNLKTKYNKAETNVENIQSMLEGHQVQLLKDIAMLDKMYELNKVYFKELSMYILAGKKKLAEVESTELPAAQEKARRTGLPEDCLLYTSCSTAVSRSSVRVGTSCVSRESCGAVSIFFSSIVIPSCIKSVNGTGLQIPDWSIPLGQAWFSVR